MRISDKFTGLPVDYCQWCGGKLDSTSSISESGDYSKPVAGSPTVCGECGGWLVFREDMTLRKMDADDILRLSSEEHQALIIVTKAIKMAKDLK